ncbi:uncharacterized protein LOC143276867 [Babylonia areolata]|uniref:uncharacterized protein LOC143276867 n=1 Tax=Babylonia areolata TaxID=304850 RepID=UPI003FD110B4
MLRGAYNELRGVQKRPLGIQRRLRGAYNKLRGIQKSLSGIQRRLRGAYNNLRGIQKSCVAPRSPGCGAVVEAVKSTNFFPRVARARVTYHSLPVTPPRRMGGISTISTIANGRYKNRLSLEKCREFGQWYAMYLHDSDYSIMACSTPPDSRMTFHPDHELPLLRSWYQDYPNPSHDKFVIFAHELNKGHVRQDRPKVTPQKIKIWWKNERQRERRHVMAATTEAVAHAAASSSSTSASAPREEGEVDVGGGGVRGPLSVKSRKRPRSSSQGSRSRMAEGCKGRAVVVVEEEDEDEDGGGGSGQHRSGDGGSSHAWAPPPPPPPHKADKGSQSTCGTEDSSFLTSLASLPPDRRLPLKPSRKSAMTPMDSAAAFPSAISQGQGHMLSPGGPHSASWQSSFLAWSTQRRSPELREVGVTSPDPGLLLPWQHHRLPVLPPQRAGSRSAEGERESAAAPSAHGGFGAVERYRFSQTHDLSFAAPPASSSSGSMDFSNIL